MPIGYLIARTYADAAHYDLMLDGLFIIMGVWGWLRESADEGIGGEEFISASIGIGGAVLAKYFDSSRERVAVAMVLSAAGAAAWTYTVYADLVWMSSVRTRIANGEVTVDWQYWPAQWISLLILVVIACNHAVLAMFCRRRIRSSSIPTRGGEYDDIL